MGEEGGADHADLKCPAAVHWGATGRREQGRGRVCPGCRKTPLESCGERHEGGRARRRLGQGSRPGEAQVCVGAEAAGMEKRGSSRESQEAEGIEAGD